MTIPASVTKHKNLLGIGAAVFSVGLFGAAAFAVYENQTTAAPAPATADAPAVTPEPSAAPSDQPAQGRDMLKSVARDALKTAATYLGLPPKDLMAQLGAGKSLADVANATTGKSRDGLVAALTDAASTSLDGAVASGRRSSDQAATAKMKLPALMGKLVDRKGAPKK